MFDVSFSEMMVIAIVALIVIGPEKLPKVARTVGALIGRMQRYVATVKEEVDRETRFAELQELQEEIKRGVESTRASVAQSVQGLDQGVHQQLDSVTQSVNADEPALTSDIRPADKTNTADLFEAAPVADSVDLVPVKKIVARKPRAKKSAIKDPAVPSS